MGNYTIEHLTFSYPEQERIVLDDVSTSFSQGEFIVLCGPSGSGKSTLLRQLKPILAPHGTKSGVIQFEGRNVEEMNQREQTEQIGYVLQSPDNQIVTDKVWHELAFGLESLGYDTPTIRLRVAEMASFFGIQNWIYKDVSELSGGQKQILNLAAIMVMQPSVLILDEPTSQLDPIAATNFLETIQRINQEFGTTIILTEHRLDEVFPMADKVLVLDQGALIVEDTPRKVGNFLSDHDHKMFLSMPVPMRIYNGVKNDLEVPITVREGRKWLDNYAAVNEIKEVEKSKPPHRNENQEPSVEVEDAWFKYEKNLPDVVKGASIKAYPGEFLALLGGNGTGKTTLMNLISDVHRPYRGKVKLKGKNSAKIPSSEKYDGLLGTLPQNPQTLFVKKTVKEDLYEMFKGRELTADDQDLRVHKIVSLCDLEQLMNQHPYDLSGGEQQRVALAKILLMEPEILLLDEPTKGMDAEFKTVFAAILQRLMTNGVTVIMISHDIEFCAMYADYCALFFDGNVVSTGPTQEFFAGNNFYTSAANRMSRHQLTDAVTANDVIGACGGTKRDEIDDSFFDESFAYDYEAKILAEEVEEVDDSSGIKRKVTGILSLIVIVLTVWQGYPTISAFALGQPMNNGVSLFSSGSEIWSYVGLMVLSMGSLFVFVHSIFKKDDKKIVAIQVSKDERKLDQRTKIAAILILLFIPLTIFMGVYYLGDRKYYFISLLIMLQTMIPFVLVFEGRKPQARELVIIAVLCALGVAGRAAFFMLPQFKPVAAIVIIAGVALGGESGFLVGAMTMLLSNMLYSQGPWTPWQMFAMGIIGFLAGILFRKGFLVRSRGALAVFGGITVFFVYGIIMNVASVVMYQSNITWPMITASLVTGLPFDLIHAMSTSFFLLLIGEPMLEKLDRIKVKYGLVEALS